MHAPGVFRIVDSLKKANIRFIILFTLFICLAKHFPPQTSQNNKMSEPEGPQGLSKETQYQCFTNAKPDRAPNTERPSCLLFLRPSQPSSSSWVTLHLRGFSFMQTKQEVPKTLRFEAPAAG